MAKEETRYFITHKPSQYTERFMQVDFKNLGIAMGKLSKIGAKNLYLYLVSNADNFQFELKVANYANWLGDPIFEGDIKNEGKSATYRKQVNDGIKQLEEAGYLVEKFPKIYDFYEFGINSSGSNNQLHLEQIVTKETKSSNNDNLLQMKPKVLLEQSVTDETNCDKSNKELQKEKSVAFIF